MEVVWVGGGGELIEWPLGKREVQVGRGATDRPLDSLTASAVTITLASATSASVIPAAATPRLGYGYEKRSTCPLVTDDGRSTTTDGVTDIIRFSTDASYSVGTVRYTYML